jgi:hypothetical protein
MAECIIRYLSELFRYDTAVTSQPIDLAKFQVISIVGGRQFSDGSGSNRTSSAAASTVEVVGSSLDQDSTVSRKPPGRASASCLEASR